VAGAQGGAKSIVTSQLGGKGTVRVWSNGSLIDGQPAIYLDNPNHHEENLEYRQIASFEPFAGGAGVTVATTSTTGGADLLVSGKAGDGAEVRKIGLARSDPAATALAPTLITTLPPLAGLTAAVPLAGR
jgi:hypothetical protein